MLEVIVGGFDFVLEGDFVLDKLAPLSPSNTLSLLRAIKELLVSIIIFLEIEIVVQPPCGEITLPLTPTAAHFSDSKVINSISSVLGKTKSVLGKLEYEKWGIDTKNTH